MPLEKRFESKHRGAPRRKDSEKRRNKKKQGGRRARAMIDHGGDAHSEVESSQAVLVEAEIAKDAARGGQNKTREEDARSAVSVKEKVGLVVTATIVIALLGSLAHFWYEWSGGNPGIKWFAASNESTFEHMKLVLWPWLFFWGALTLCDLLIWKRVRHNLLSTAGGLLIAVALIPCLFYLYTEGFKVEDDVGADIFIFFLSVFCGVCYKVLFIEMEIDQRFDLMSGTFALVGTLIWFTTCSYTECANIYEDPLQQNLNVTRH